eukprot:gene5523-5576_t
MPTLMVAGAWAWAGAKEAIDSAVAAATAVPRSQLFSEWRVDETRARAMIVSSVSERGSGKTRQCRSSCNASGMCNDRATTFRGHLPSRQTGKGGDAPLRTEICCDGALLRIHDCLIFRQEMNLSLCCAAESRLAALFPQVL